MYKLILLLTIPALLSVACSAQEKRPSQVTDLGTITITATKLPK
jgi:hypothetical protein